MQLGVIVEVGLGFRIFFRWEVNFLFVLLKIGCVVYGKYSDSWNSCVAVYKNEILLEFLTV